jgi:hypothetical protein
MADGSLVLDRWQMARSNPIDGNVPDRWQRTRSMATHPIDGPSQSSTEFRNEIKKENQSQ